MTLTNSAYLFIDGSQTVEFEFQSFDVQSAELDKDLLLGGDTGQLLNELLDWVGIDDGADAKGYTIDGGIGSDMWQLRIEPTAGEIGPWGPVSEQNGGLLAGDTFVAAHDKDPWTKAQVLKYWVRTERLDSLNSPDFGPASGTARLYIHEWSDGTYADEPGLFGEPVTVTPLSVEYQVERDSPSIRQIDLTLLRSDPFDFDSRLPTP